MIEPADMFKPPVDDHQDPQQGLEIAGWLTAILLPVVGFFVGIVLLVKNRVGHGIAVMVLSVVAVVIWTSVLTQETEPTFAPVPSSLLEEETVEPGYERVIREQNEAVDRATAEFDACVEHRGLDIHGSERDLNEAMAEC